MVSQKRFIEAANQLVEKSSRDSIHRRTGFQFMPDQAFRPCGLEI